MKSAAALIVAVALVVACAPKPRQPKPLEIETVEVGGTVDQELSTEGDEKGKSPSVNDGWILEGMLPDDLPLHRPARLVDSTETADGRRTFVFHTTTPRDTVRAGLERSLRQADWSADRTASGLAAAKGEERVDFSFSELRPGTEIRVTY